MDYNLKEIDALILCGGFGRRLAPVLGDKPKVLAEIDGRVFLDILIDNLLRFGFRRIILSVGYKKEKIMDRFRDKIKKIEYDLIFSEEEIPLGTGGALKKAESLIKSNTFLAMNGDSFCDVDFNKLLDSHIDRKALLTMVLVRSKTAQDYGSIKLDSSCRIVDYKEKIASGGERIVNAGIYLMQKDVFSKMPDDGAIFSLEYDFFPKIKEIDCFGYMADSELLDIGTRERYEKAKLFFRNRLISEDTNG